MKTNYLGRANELSFEDGMHERCELLLGALRWRYAVKQFDSTRRIPEDVWAVLEEALLLTPSAYGLQPWQFTVVQDDKVRLALVKASLNQSQVKDASHFVVVSAKTSLDETYVEEFVGQMAKVRGVTRASLEPYYQMIIEDMVKGPKGNKHWAAKQAYIALGNLLTSAALLGVDTCPMEGIDPDTYDMILGHEQSAYRCVVVCALGYRHRNDSYAHMAKVRFEKGRVLKYI